jgi:hypothetical protein
MRVILLDGPLPKTVLTTFLTTVSVACQCEAFAPDSPLNKLPIESPASR